MNKQNCDFRVISICPCLIGFLFQKKIRNTFAKIDNQTGAKTLDSSRLEFSTRIKTKYQMLNISCSCRKCLPFQWQACLCCQLIYRTKKYHHFWTLHNLLINIYLLHCRLSWQDQRCIFADYRIIKIFYTSLNK